MSKKHRLKVVEGSSAEAHKAYSGKNFTPHDLVSFTPKTYPQEQFFSSYYSGVPLIMQVGSAGTGKTACALYAALSEVFDKGTVYDKVIITRSAVQAREIGFLKGDENEKNEVYELPYSTLCNELIKFKTNNYDNLKAKGMIDFKNTSFLRGLTFDNCIVIVDEAQNMTYHELSTIMTRSGVNTKIVFCGDVKQSDLHKKGDVSGLGKFIEVVDTMESKCYDVVEYRPQDIVRSGLVKEFLIAEEEFNG